MDKINWFEPLAYKWVVTPRTPAVLSVSTFFGVAILITSIAKWYPPPKLGWLATNVIAVVAGLTAGYVVPQVMHLGNRVCTVSEEGIQCDAMALTRWQRREWAWSSIRYCCIKKVQVRSKAYNVLFLKATSGEEFSMGMPDKVEVPKVESVILRSGCQLRSQ